MKVKALNLTDFSIDQLRQNGYMPWLCSLKYLHFILMVAYIPAKCFEVFPYLLICSLKNPYDYQGSSCLFSRDTHF